MGDSYNAAEEYQKFSYEQYCRFRGIFEDAIKASDGKPLFLAIGEMAEPSPLSSIFNMITPDKNEHPAKAAAYSYFAAVKAAEDLVGRDKTMLSFELDPNLRGYVMKMSGSRVGGMPFRAEIAGCAQDEGYRVSYDDMKFRSKDYISTQSRFEAEIQEIGKQATRTSRAPEIILHYGSAKYIGVLQGHNYDDLLAKGNELSVQDAIDPFGGVFAQRFYFNAAQNQLNLLEATFLYGEIRPMMYFSDPSNVAPIVPPGAMPDDTHAEDILKTVIKASDDYRMAQEGEKTLDFSQRVSDSMASPVLMKL